MKLAKHSLLWLLVAGAVVVLSVMSKKTEGTPTFTQNFSRDWQTQYTLVATADPAYGEATADSPEYDLTHPLIRDTAASLAAQSVSAKDAMQKTLSYVYARVIYNADESNWACLSNDAPDVLISGSGQCDTQSTAVIALLRAQGIAAVPVGGCIYPAPTCTLQALFDLNGPKIGVQAIGEMPDVFPRAASGGLHAWVAAYDDASQSWIALEATNGRFADTNCWTYHVEMFPENGDKTHLCASTNQAYARACADHDLAGLNTHGLGLQQAVTP